MQFNLKWFTVFVLALSFVKIHILSMVPNSSKEMWLFRPNLSSTHPTVSSIRFPCLWWSCHQRQFCCWGEHYLLENFAGCQRRHCDSLYKVWNHCHAKCGNMQRFWILCQPDLPNMIIKEEQEARWWIFSKKQGQADSLHQQEMSYLNHSWQPLPVHDLVFRDYYKAIFRAMWLNFEGTYMESKADDKVPSTWSCYLSHKVWAHKNKVHHKSMQMQKAWT